MSELNPCPFCGNKMLDITDVRNCEDCANFEAEEVCPAFEPGKFCGMKFVVCSFYKGGCGASSGWYKTDAEVIEAWNKRANEVTKNE